MSYAWTGVAVEGGAAGVERFKRDYLAALPPRRPDLVPGDRDGRGPDPGGRPAPCRRPRRLRRPGRGGHPPSGGPGAGAPAAVPTATTSPALRAMGAGPGAGAGGARSPASSARSLAGAAGAVAVAVALSPVAPIGPLRRVEADPGCRFDWTVLALGAAGFALVLGVAACSSPVRQAPHRRLARGRLVGATPVDAGRRRLRRRAARCRPSPACGWPWSRARGARRCRSGPRWAGRSSPSWPWSPPWCSAPACGRSSTSPSCTGGTGTSPSSTRRATARSTSRQAAAILDGDPASPAWSGVYFQSVDLDGP